MSMIKDRYHDLLASPKHDMAIISYFCEWSRCWIAYDENLEPDADGNWRHPKGEGRTRRDAELDLIEQWEDAQ